MLTKVGVVGLFSEFDHEIPIEPEWEFVIAYGLNGVGKTRFLELINASMNLDVDVLSSIEFSKITLTADSGDYMIVAKVPQTHDSEGEEPPLDSSLNEALLRYSLFSDKGKSRCKSWTQKSSDSDSEFVRRSFGGRWIQVDRGYWQDPSDGETLHIDELRSRYGMPRRKRASLPEPLQEFIDAHPTYLIETQRLGLPILTRTVMYGRSNSSEPRSEGSPKWTIDRYSQDLKRRIERELARNSIESQRLDRTFPSRILTQSLEDADSEGQIRERHQEQNEQRNRLSSIGLMSDETALPLPSRALEGWQRAVLTSYLDDNAIKLSTFDELLNKINLLETLINQRFLRKRLRVTAEDGLEVLSTTRGTPIPPNGLSSGEQHELVLIYNLLFRVERGTLVLIDEPEISLHVAWQMKFLDDVVQIAKSSKFRFIVATHSPQIIDKWWSRTVPLGPGEETADAAISER